MSEPPISLRDMHKWQAEQIESVLDTLAALDPDTSLTGGTTTVGEILAYGREQQARTPKWEDIPE